jgi:hypothetical protein
VSASAFLTRLASTATAEPGIADAYWKVRFETLTPSDHTGGSQLETTATLWYGRDGGRWITTPDGTVLKASNSKAPFVVGIHTALDWSQINALPTDPAELERSLHSMVTPTPVATAIGRLLISAPLSAAQRSALFTILSHQPGVTIRKGVTDTTGRPGTALNFPFGPTTTPTEMVTLLLADDGTLLELTEIASKDEPSPGVPSGNANTNVHQTIRIGDILSRTTYIEVEGTNISPGH